jgi:hypothetical protein
MRTGAATFDVAGGYPSICAFAERVGAVGD